jgi:hypothetical protein
MAPLLTQHPPALPLTEVAVEVTAVVVAVEGAVRSA